MACLPSAGRQNQNRVLILKLFFCMPMLFRNITMTKYIIKSKMYTFFSNDKKYNDG